MWTLTASAEGVIPELAKKPYAGKSSQWLSDLIWPKLQTWISNPQRPWYNIMVVKMVKLSESEASMSCITTSPPPSSKATNSHRQTLQTQAGTKQIWGALGHTVNEVPDNLTALLPHHHETSAAPGEDGSCIASEAHQGKDCMVVNMWLKPWISSRVPIKILSPRRREHPLRKSDCKLLV